MSSERPTQAGHTYQNIQIGGQARVILGNTQETTVRANFEGEYTHSSLKPVPNYVPRPTLQQQIRDRLHTPPDLDGRGGDGHESRTVVVWGLGGSGKSQLVLNYIREHRQEYEALFWVEAGQKETIERDYIEIYRKLFLNEATASSSPIKIEHAVPAVRSWFKQQKRRSLLVVDSADSIENKADPSYIDLIFYLPDAASVDTIITTRSSQTRKISSLKGVEVREMAPTEAVELFRKCAELEQPSRETEEEMLTIVNELECLALAVTLAGSYVAATPRLTSNLKLYLPQYKLQRQKLLSRKAEHNIHRYSESVLSTWETSFAAIERQSVVASRLLCLLAVLNFDDIFLQLFNRPSDFHGATDDSRPADRHWLALLASETTVDQFVIESAFSTLQTYSFLSWRTDQESYTMHKLVHAWSHDRLSVEQRQEWSLAALELIHEVIQAYRDTLTVQTRMVSHVMANFMVMSRACGSSYPWTRHDRNLVALIGDFLRRLGQWNNEYEVRDFHVQVTKQVLGMEDPVTLISMANLASTYRNQGRWTEAEELFLQVMEMFKRVFGPEHPETLISMGSLASTYRNQGRWTQAEELDVQVMETFKRVLGPEHPDTLTSMANLASTYRNQGRWAQAEELSVQVMETEKRVLGPEHPDTLTSMANLASAFWNQGRWAQAEELFVQVMETKKRVLGPEHPSTLTSMANLASTYRNQGRWVQAEGLEMQVMETFKRVLGPEHPDTLTSIANLASTYRNQGRWAQAEELFVQVMETFKRVLGPEHPSTLTSMANLASTYQGQDRWTEAEELFVQVMETSKRVLGQEHPDTLISMANLASTYRNQGRWTQAEELFVQVMEMFKRVHGPEHPETLTSMSNLALTYRNQGRWAQAEELFVQVMETFKRVLGPEHPDTLTSMANLAHTLNDRGHKEEAVKLMVSCLNLRMKVLGKSHNDTLITLATTILWLGLDGHAEDESEETIMRMPGAWND